MKSLDQVEARTPISSAPFTISTSGSYYLTKNLAVTSGDAIVITTSGVNLDLNGFTISSSSNPASGTAIVMSSGSVLKDITILNGHIRGGVSFGSGTYSGPGFLVGIGYNSSAPNNALVKEISVAGCLQSGIGFNNSSLSTVDHCSASQIGGSGIAAGVIDHSVANFCGQVAIDGQTVTNSFGQSSGGLPGIRAVTATNCSGLSGSGSGVTASAATNCYGTSSSGFGVLADTASNCWGISTSFPGLSFRYTADSCYGISTSSEGILGSGNAANCYGHSSSSNGMTCLNAVNCYGESNTSNGMMVGLSANGSNPPIGIGNAENCVGWSKSGAAGVNGLLAWGLATNSIGICGGAGTGLNTVIAVACRGYAGMGGNAVLAGNTYNMPP